MPFFFLNSTTSCELLLPVLRPFTSGSRKVGSVIFNLLTFPFMTTTTSVRPSNIHHSLTHSVLRLNDRSIVLSKTILHTLPSSASSFNSQYSIFSLRSSSSCLRLLRCLPVKSICPHIFPSITCFRRPVLRKI